MSLAPSHRALLLSTSCRLNAAPPGATLPWARGRRRSAHRPRQRQSAPSSSPCTASSPLGRFSSSSQDRPPCSSPTSPTRSCLPWSRQWSTAAAPPSSRPGSCLRSALASQVAGAVILMVATPPVLPSSPTTPQHCRTPVFRITGEWDLFRSMRHASSAR